MLYRWLSEYFVAQGTHAGEGTGTWPDYLVNRDDKKNEGPFGEKNCTEVEK